MTIFRFLLFFYALAGIFVAGGLFFKRSNASFVLLSAFCLLFSLEALDFLYSTSILLEYFPLFYGRYYFISGFLYGPICLFYVSSVLQQPVSRKRILIHLLPAALVFIYMLDIQVMPSAARIQFFRDHFIDRIMPVNYARGVHNLAYGVVFIVKIRRHGDKLDETNRLFTDFFCSIHFLTAVLVSWLTVFAGGWRDFIIYYLIAFSIVFIAGYLLYTAPEFLKGIRVKYLGSGLTKAEMKVIHRKLEAQMTTSHAYLDSNLTLSSLSRMVGEKPHRVTQTLSVLLDVNYNTFVNHYRVKHALDMLQDPLNSRYSIEGIGLESGFNNKVTFYRAFKEITSKNPSAYRTEPFTKE